MDVGHSYPHLDYGLPQPSSPETNTKSVDTSSISSQDSANIQDTETLNSSPVEGQIHSIGEQKNFSREIESLNNLGLPDEVKNNILIALQRADTNSTNTILIRKDDENELAFSLERQYVKPEGSEKGEFQWLLKVKSGKGVLTQKFAEGEGYVLRTGGSFKVVKIAINLTTKKREADISIDVTEGAKEMFRKKFSGPLENKNKFMLTKEGQKLLKECEEQIISDVQKELDYQKKYSPGLEIKSEILEYTGKQTSERGKELRQSEDKIPREAGHRMISFKCALALGELNLDFIQLEFGTDSFMKNITNIFHTISQMHEDGIVHRDLTMANILVTYNKGNLKWNVADFGLCIESEKITNILGSTNARDPMIALQQSLDYKKADIWALGSILFTIFTNDNNPFVDLLQSHGEGKLTDEDIRAVMDEKIQEIKDMLESEETLNFYPGMKELIIDLLKKEPNERPEFPEILERLSKIHFELPEGYEEKEESGDLDP